ncbi:MAG: hypothetical protein KF805_16600 [Phycisphaeraceae bacterium]|nr:hypothetical protein [Phycisphaeraceae bacterium]
MIVRTLSMLAGVTAFCALSHASPVSASFTSGSVTGAGFPEPLAQQSPVSTTTKRSGGGSTGGGFGGTAAASVDIVTSDTETRVAISGTANHISDLGYTAAYTQQEVVLSLTEAANYSIANLSRTLVSGNSTSFVPVTFQAITGAITTTGSNTGKLAPGTYRVKFGAAAGRDNVFSFSVVSEWYNQFTPTGCANTVLDWKLTLTKPCTGDLNGDGVVDDADFSLFAAAYNILGCGLPGMPAGCPADFNHDSVVDDADFVLFVPAYNALICP